MKIHIQERQGNVAVDLGLNGDFILEVQVQAKLQSFLGCDGSLGLADDLPATNGGEFGRGELGGGLLGRHGVEAEESAEELDPFI